MIKVEYFPGKKYSWRAALPNDRTSYVSINLNEAFRAV